MADISARRPSEPEMLCSCNLHSLAVIMAYGTETSATYGLIITSCAEYIGENNHGDRTTQLKKNKITKLLVI